MWSKQVSYLPFKYYPMAFAKSMKKRRGGGGRKIREEEK
jgi:hypothetical protein